MDPGQQKELNLLLARPQVPEITEKVGAKAEEMVNFVDEKPEEPANQTVINVDDQEGHTYVPQVGTNICCLDSDQIKLIKGGYTLVSGWSPFVNCTVK